ncbi:Adenosylhomocysteinase [Operophtera brumata]|uniref:Adenosylhomocysteinase n=1 Tax=Operophtera brumata TaxID=104452 RepID=A0A0L7L2Q6_OPEBR|nr:Adenosylhomocysteinase [Operophtera brumata]
MSILKKKVYTVNEDMKDSKKKNTVIEDFRVKTNPVIEDMKKNDVIEITKKKREEEITEVIEESSMPKPNMKKRHSIVSGRSDFYEDEGVQPHEKAIAAGQPNPAYCVRNIEQNAFGRREIEIAEQEMPGIMALRARAKEDKPLKDAKILSKLSEYYPLTCK